MYQKPRLEKYGSFSELTKSGFAGGGDGCIILNPSTGAVVDGNPADGTFNAGLPRCGS
jgi:hypothetical protein